MTQKIASFGGSAGMASSTSTISLTFFTRDGSGRRTDASTTTPVIARLRNGTSTRLPAHTDPASRSGISYVNSERSGTGSATSQ